MYLKSIETVGFKSFAHKIVFDFHDGITGIVGPNGSGKSNVVDAVRWVLGEQSAKQLRGTSMQDVIFAGTETRKPLSYAYVALTLDNSDHTLPVDYEEVTIARRVYRSGESEYLLNGTPCRLRDVQETFYDTGIGKEGYSIIGQGQIEKILSGKPEERRELFDEAVGIVKYKKRKAATTKKLESERENLVRINDILSELERQVGPLERQSANAKEYLKLKDEQKTLDVNLFLNDTLEITDSLEKNLKNREIASNQLAENQQKEANIKEENAALEQEINDIEERMNSLREEQSKTTVAQGQLESQIKILEEQIKYARNSADNFEERKAVLMADKEIRQEELDKYQAEKDELSKMLSEVEGRLNSIREQYDTLQDEIRGLNEGIEKNNQELINLLNERGKIQSNQQRLDTLFEQTNIRKAALTQRLVERKTKEQTISDIVVSCQKEFDESKEKVEALRKKEADFNQEINDWNAKYKDTELSLSVKTADYHKAKAALESLKNIAERYDGYGSSIRKVMEQKASNKGIRGVVSDLISVDKKYEVAIETALGGNIQNIVTDDEACAKKMINFLKENKLGRATFLPMTAVDGRGNFKKTEVLSEKGVIGMANELVSNDKAYDGVIAYLLGRVVVTEDIDSAIALAKKNNYSLHIVSLEGEYLSPGGSMAGGRFKNSSNLLGRNREIEEFEGKIAELEKEIADFKNRLEEISTAKSLLVDEKEENAALIQEAILVNNTAKINLDRANEDKKASLDAYNGLQSEEQDIETQLSNIKTEKEEAVKAFEANINREKEIKDQSDEFMALLDEKSYRGTSVSRDLSEIQIEEASSRQKVDFVSENINRVTAEILRDEDDINKLVEDASSSASDITKKLSDIEEIKKTIIASNEAYKELEDKLAEVTALRESKNNEYKSFFDKIKEVADGIAQLENEIYRLDTQKERLEDTLTKKNNFMWEEYELTFHNAMSLKDENLGEPSEMKARLNEIRDLIRKMGNVNVNAIEEYKEVSERYEFLKTQHDDLVEAEATLVGIIKELDEGMQKQFKEGFAQIQKEFDKSFRELFGGGKGSLELVDDEDLLETGIRIIGQPPGKKLVNMMQMSGGEKSLTAIALLFAIQNMKPSPFCILDEVEAALDDANVDRFSKYVQKLSNKTQYIVITHKRGTMNAADRLYGITMQEKGVSVLVSVDLIESQLEK